MSGIKDKRLSISYDRNNVTVRLYSENSFLYYKDCRKNKSGFLDCDFIGMPIGLVTPNGYYYSVRGRISLKEYVAGEETVSPEMLAALVESIAETLKRAFEFRVDYRDVLFDYNCVFLQGSCKSF